MNDLSRVNKAPRVSSGNKVRDFQRKIYQKAKQEPKFRFYSLYDKIYQLNFLREAYARVKRQQGSAGLDGMRFKDIEMAGLHDFLLEIQKDLKDGSYRPSPVKHVHIPKANGKMRPLGIPTIRDRVAQMACKLVIEPIFEADFDDSSFGFRPKCSSKEAIRCIKNHLKSGKTQVYDADLSSYFDTIPHTKLLKLIAQRISDGRVLSLIKKWLKTPVSEDGKLSGGKKNKLGTPQGGVISPLLANIYLNLLDKLVRTHKAFRGVEIVRYADDFVLLGRQVGEQVLTSLNYVLKKMELLINDEKSRLVRACRDSFDFLGFTFRHDRSLYGNGQYYWNVLPSHKSMKSLRSKIRDRLSLNQHRNPRVVVSQLNPLLRGWLNYFCIEGVSYMKIPRRKVRIYLRDRLYRYQRRKSQKYNYSYCGDTMNRLIREENLIDPEKYEVFGNV